MIKRRSRLVISSNSYRLSRFRHLGGCFMAAASNFMLGQRDFQRRFSSNVSTSSLIGTSNGKFSTNGFRLKGCCSENYGNLLRNINDIKIDHGNSNGVRAYGPFFPQLVRASEEFVKMEEQQKSLNSRAINGGGAANRLDNPSPEKIMLAVDVDEGN